MNSTVRLSFKEKFVEICICDSREQYIDPHKTPNAAENFILIAIQTHTN